MTPINPILKTIGRGIAFSAMFLVAAIIYIFFTALLFSTFGLYALVGMVAFLVVSFVWIFKMK